MINEAQTQTQSDFEKNIMFLVTIGILAICFILDFVSLRTDTLSTAVAIVEQPVLLHIDLNYGATTITSVTDETTTMGKYGTLCRNSFSDADSIACKLHLRGGLWIKFQS